MIVCPLELRPGGGGFDFLCGLPIVLELERRGHYVILASYSFTRLDITCMLDRCGEASTPVIGVAGQPGWVAAFGWFFREHDLTDRSSVLAALHSIEPRCDLGRAGATEPSRHTACEKKPVPLAGRVEIASNSTDGCCKMTPELRQSVAARARALQVRLNAFSIEPVAASVEAARLFEDATDEVHSRWLNLERGGYGDLVSAAPLHQVLRVPPGDRLAAHVTAYRTQRGRDVTTGRTGEIRHFFVESLPDLAAARERIARAATASTVLLDFGPEPGDPTYPATGEFGRDVFDRILAGFLAALHLHLGSLIS